MAALRKPQRVLVKLRKGKEVVTDANFAQCILNYFGYTSGLGKVYTHVKDNFLILSDVQQSNEISVVMKHPSFCPYHNLTQSDVNSFPDELATRGVDVGSVVLVESCDGKILLQRRAKHLRIFPGIWVPPGGHMELNESLIDAGLRELREEIGLHITLPDCVNEQIRPLCLWESTFPPNLTSGLPKRHHIVAYLLVRLRDGLTADVLEKKINFDPQEVEACAWLSRDFITAIVNSNEETKAPSVPQGNLPPEFSAIVEDDQRQQVKVKLPTDPLLATMDDNNSSERVSTGTKFALEQYLALG